MVYSVKFKRKNAWFWRTIKKVKGDLISPDLPNVRILILEDESRLEIPLNGTQFYFCPKRFLAIKQKMEQEAGQSIPVKTG
jgi:hypothetical protein